MMVVVEFAVMSTTIQMITSTTICVVIITITVVITTTLATYITFTTTTFSDNYRVVTIVCSGTTPSRRISSRYSVGRIFVLNISIRIHEWCCDYIK